MRAVRSQPASQVRPANPHARTALYAAPPFKPRASARNQNQSISQRDTRPFAIIIIALLPSTIDLNLIFFFPSLNPTPPSPPRHIPPPPSSVVGVALYNVSSLHLNASHREQPDHTLLSTSTFLETGQLSNIYQP